MDLKLESAESYDCTIEASRSAAVEKAMANVESLPIDATSSMQRDIVSGRPSELESQNGAVVRMAEEVELEMPTHELIYRTLKPLEIEARRKAGLG